MRQCVDCTQYHNPKDAWTIVKDYGQSVSLEGTAAVIALCGNCAFKRATSGAELFDAEEGRKVSPDLGYLGYLYNDLLSV